MSGLPGLIARDLVRTLGPDEADGLVVHEVLAQSMLQSVTADRSHAYDFAVETISDADGSIRVKMNAAAVLRREVRRRSWRHETVAIGVTGGDPYGPVEARYRLMPGVLSALAETGTPLALHTGSDLILRDLSLLKVIRHAVPTTVVVTLPTLDDELCRRADPAGSAPAARVDAVRRLAEAGLAPRVRIAPLLPCLTDATAQLDELLGAVAGAGASGVSVSVLRLADDGYLEWLAEQHPALLRRYRSLYGRGSFVPAEYAVRLRERMEPLVRAHGLAGAARDEPDPVEVPHSAAVPVAAAPDEQALTLF